MSDKYGKPLLSDRVYNERSIRVFDKKRVIIPRLIAFLTVAVLPPLKIYVFACLWRDYVRPVFELTCTCNCWDTVFKGPYENENSKYKHFYFNATRNNLKIWILLMVFIIALYESLRNVFELALRRILRYEMLVVFLTSIPSHYYSWWTFTNYYNDDFYEQWDNQMFFAVTEVISTIAVLTFANKKNKLIFGNVLIITGIALLHIIMSCSDQFIHNVVLGHGRLHQVIRDIMLMVGDMTHCFIPLISYVCRRGLRCTKFAKGLMLFLFVIFVTFLLILLASH